VRILQLTKKFPYPAKDGESVAILAMAKGYAIGGHSVDLMAMNTLKHHVDTNSQSGIDEYYKNSWQTDVDTGVNAKDAFINLFTSQSYNIERFNIASYSNNLRKVLKANSYDVVQLETVYLTPYIDVVRAHSDALIILRSHNIENEIWYNLSKSEPNLVRKWYYNLCYKRLKRYEIDHVGDYDMILAITDRDKDKYKSISSKLRIFTAQVGIDLSKYNQVEMSEDCTCIGYIGSLDWRPNIEGLNWFFKNVWPDIFNEFPNMSFHLAGRNANPDFVSKLPVGVEFFGEIADAPTFIAELDGVVVPLMSGSGIRIKILESMAMSKTVFSTNKGFEGIDITDMENAIKFNDSKDMISKFRRWKKDAGLKKKINSNSLNLISENFDIATINRDIITELKNISRQ